MLLRRLGLKRDITREDLDSIVACTTDVTLATGQGGCLDVRSLLLMRRHWFLNLGAAHDMQAPYTVRRRRSLVLVLSTFHHLGRL